MISYKINVQAKLCQLPKEKAYKNSRNESDMQMLKAIPSSKISCLRK